MKPTEFIAAEHAAAPRIHRGRLFRKYFLLILALVCGALLISSAIGVYFSYQENKVAIASLQREKAVAAAARLEQYVHQIEQHLAFAALPYLGAEGVEQRRVEFFKLMRIVPDVTDIAQIDARGREVLKVSRLEMDTPAGADKDRSQDPAFREAQPGKTWFGSVYFRKETEPYMAVAVRSGKADGPVTVAELNLKFLWDVITRIKVGKTGKAYVVDRTGHLVADPDIGLVLRKTNLSGLEQVKAALHPDADADLAMLAKDFSGREVLAAHATIDSLGWKVFVEQPVAEVYETLNATILRSAALLVAGLLFSALAAVWLARRIVRPIQTLQAGAAKIGAGELEQRIEVRTGDELEALADQFNEMSARLRESYAGLERKVEERTSELKESLEQQTATAEILKVISSSPTDTRPVFEAIARAGEALFEDANTWVVVREGDQVCAAAISERDPERIAKWRAAFPTPMTHDYLNATAMLERAVVSIDDVEQLPRPLKAGTANFAATGYRAVTITPMLRGSEAIGAIGVARLRPGPLRPKQISLLQTFADQAVIAVENVRLFNETTDALEQQKASAEVLGAISASIADTAPVFDKILESCQRLFEGYLVGLTLVDEDRTVRLAAYQGPQRDEMHRIYPMPLDRSTGTGAAILERKVVHYPDTTAGGTPEQIVRGAQTIGFRSIIFAPLLASGSGIGALWVARVEAGSFDGKQISLLQTFADQAVIAIQNARLFHEIEDKSRQLAIANQHKSDFLANMSHELRTPLNAIIGFSEVLAERYFGELSEKQDEYVKDIHDSGKHLLSLINDVLDLSKIEAGRMELDLADFDVPGAIDNALTLVRERAQRHGITLKKEVDPALGSIRADERKVKQIMLNLLSNAVKFTPMGGTVGVAAHRNGAAVEIAVSDTGVGIAPEDQEAIFEEFRQVGRDYTKKAEGTGLGLALTRRFIELHGGQIRVESAPGKGSTFSFTLPMQPAARGQA